VLGGATVKQLIELSGQHLSIRAIARRLDISRNTAPGGPVAKPRPRRPIHSGITSADVWRPAWKTA
jgi:hypothetical protein